MLAVNTQAESPVTGHQGIYEMLAQPLGALSLSIVHIELIQSRQKVLRVFIERENSEHGAGVSLDDCAQASRAIAEILDQSPEVDALFGGSYELEVSSPGVDRPLRKLVDFSRFKGKEAKIHVLRPLTVEEIENEDYFKVHPKQKKFVGIIDGVEAQKVKILVSPKDILKKPKKGIGI